MKPLEIPIYFNPDEDIDRSSLGLPEVEIEDCQIKYCLFINIDAISPYISDRDKISMTKIFSGETNFIAPIPYHKMVSFISKNMGLPITTLNHEK